MPRTLGIWLALAALASVGAVALTGRPAPVVRAGWGALGATLLVFAAGLVDDLAPAGPRGLRNHLRALAAGQVSTGIVKLIVVVAAAVVAIALQPGGSGGVRVAGVVLVAACANVWNGLDVRPGRAIKFGSGRVPRSRAGWISPCCPRSRASRSAPRPRSGSTSTNGPCSATAARTSSASRSGSASTWCCPDGAWCSRPPSPWR